MQILKAFYFLMEGFLCRLHSYSIHCVAFLEPQMKAEEEKNHIKTIKISLFKQEIRQRVGLESSKISQSCNEKLGKAQTRGRSCLFIANQT